MNTRPKRRIRCDHGSRRQVIVQSLLADVFHGRIRAGQRLVTQSLATRFGVSHTPIREALVELAGIGIVDLLPNRGAVVRGVTPKEVREICQVRRALECVAVRKACGRIAATDLRELAAEFARLHATWEVEGPTLIPSARAVDTRLHDLVAAHCGNKFLAHEIGRLKTLFRAFRDVSWEQETERHDFHRLGVESAEHIAIVEALLAGDPRAAGRAMARHIKSGEYYWGRVASNAGPSPQKKTPPPQPAKGPSR
ncbi:GntR family transcriptional regulator [Fimbriiglobus ruber]|uniref:Transcriptional regulator, GntR family n=1 Tax=Fimbriiglobus ruber TaxID=1908690 RepID=A0A225DJ52_9BACT|nr:GntR family transcriptional regulator [Fimbriiglobus ruber]OWK36147.1 Transcriptional regulator, GntR family [Fimbriiglobus ruber]